MAEDDREKGSRQKPLLRDPNLYMIFAVTLSAVMGVASISPALPSMARAFDVSNEQIGLLITAFTVPGMLLTPFMGILADRLGRKVVLIPSLLIFGLAGVACAWTKDFYVLISLRFLQGIGGASLGSLNVTLIGDLYEGLRRATAMGYNGSVLSIGTASYPALGGLLALMGWYMPFYLPLLALPVAWAVYHLLKLEPQRKDQDMREYLSGVAQTLKSWRVFGLFSANFLTFVILYGAFLTYMPVLLDHRFHLSSLSIGLMLSGASVITALTSSQLGRLARRFNEGRLIRAAAVFYIIVFLAVPRLNTIPLLLLPIMLFGLAQGINIPSILNLLTYQAPTEYRAAFLSFNWMVLRGGQSLGPVIMGLMYGAYGMHGPFWLAVITGFLLLGSALLFIPASAGSA